MTSLVVCIDPGHGGDDNGAVVSGVRESEVNLQLALRLAGLLSDTRPDVFVAMTRTRDSDARSAIRRAAIAKGERSDLTISIHCNASATGDDREHGPLVFWDPSVPSAASYANRTALALARRGGEYVDGDTLRAMSCHQIKARMSPHWTGRAYYCLSAHTNVGSSAILVECGYLTNGHELLWLTSEAGQIECAQMIAAAIERRQSR